MKITYDDKKNKRIALLLCICFFSLFLLSTIYEVKESNHICNGHECPICDYIQQIEKNLNQLFAAIVTVSFLIISFSKFTTNMLLRRLFIRVLSPVELKVRMNN